MAARIITLSMKGSPEPQPLARLEFRITKKKADLERIRLELKELERKRKLAVAT